MNENNNPSETGLRNRQAFSASTYEEAFDYLCELESEPIHEDSALRIVNKVLRILTKWPRKNYIEPGHLKVIEWWEQPEVFHCV
jgi:hypothetical protein